MSERFPEQFDNEEEEESNDAEMFGYDNSHEGYPDPEYGYLAQLSIMKEFYPESLDQDDSVELDYFLSVATKHQKEMFDIYVQYETFAHAYLSDEITPELLEDLEKKMKQDEGLHLYVEKKMKETAIQEYMVWQDALYQPKLLIENGHLTAYNVKDIGAVAQNFQPEGRFIKALYEGIEVDQDIVQESMQDYFELQHKLDRSKAAEQASAEITFLVRMKKFVLSNGRGDEYMEAKEYQETLDEFIEDKNKIKILTAVQNALIA
jgi:hypothetical protein